MHVSESYWVEIAVVSIIFALGNILFGHFEERTSKLRKVGKYVLTMAIAIAISHYVSRTVAMTLLGLMFIPVIYIHGFYLPKKKGINGWTGEPKGKYYDFRGWSKDIFNQE